MKGRVEGSSSHSGVEERLSEAAERMSSSVISISSSSGKGGYGETSWCWTASA